MKKYELILLLIIIFLGGFLRIYQIEKYPPGLYIDEASIGYNAYSILTTGKDEYGMHLPLFFKSFGDYKMPVYIYAVSGVMFFLGKNELVVRLPSAIAGTLTLVVFYLFIEKIIDLDKSKIQISIKNYLPILSTFLLSISSWHIHFSRGGFEVNLALFFYLSGLYLLLMFYETKKLSYLFSGYLLFATAMYTYDVFRVLSPFSTFLSIYLLIRKSPNLKKQIILAGFLFVLICIPIIQFTFTPGGVSRFSTTSAFVDYHANSLIQKLYLYPMIYLKNYLSFFSLDYLFNFGDWNGRHQIPGFGLFYRWQLPFLILGIVTIVKQKKSALKYIVFGLLLATPIPAAIVRPSPHSLRALLFVLPLTISISIGIISFLSKIKRFRKVVLFIISLIAIYEFVIYLHFYYFHYPKVNVLDWGAGYKDVVVKSAKYKNKYEHLVVDTNLGLSLVYFHFYNNSLSPVLIDSRYSKLSDWKYKNALYVSALSRKNKSLPLIDQVYLQGQNKDIFAQFLKL